MIELHTARLTFRPLLPADAHDLFAARGDEEVMAFRDAPADASVAETASAMEIFLAEMGLGTSMH